MEPSSSSIRKCGEKSRSADQTLVLRLRDLRFCCKNQGCARRIPVFPHTSGNRTKIARYAPRQSDTSETIASSVIE